MADESLVPTDRPYGERQENKELMQMAGLPLGAAEPQQLVGAPAGSSPPPSGGGGLDLLADAQPPMGPAMGYAPPTPLERLRVRAEGTQNMLLRDVVDRLTGVDGDRPA